MLAATGCLPLAFVQFGVAGFKKQAHRKKLLIRSRVRLGWCACVCKGLCFCVTAPEGRGRHMDRQCHALLVVDIVIVVGLHKMEGISLQLLLAKECRSRPGYTSIIAAVTACVHY